MSPRRSLVALLLLTNLAAAPPLVRPFDLRDVELLDSPLRDAQRLNADYLLSLDPDRLLHYFRVEAGLPPRAPAYGGWESPTTGAGRCLGHYLSAVSAAYRATGDDRFRQRLRHTVAELSACQHANGDGCLSAQRNQRQFWADLRAGHPDALRKHRVPWYVQHKLFAGLRDVVQVADVEPDTAKAVLVRLGDWAVDVTAKLDDAGFQRMLEQEHGGMREVLVDLCQMTGDRKYLVLADRFEHRAVTAPLAVGTDALAGLHANTQVAKIVGSAATHALTGDDRELAVARTFWHAVVDHHTYANGGDSDDERFGPPDRLTLGTATSETCNTYNLLKLTRRLITFDPRPAYGDYYERAVYNHLLPAVGPGPGQFCYYTPTAGGHARPFSRPTDSFWCCVGTGMENPTQYPLGVYFHDARDLWVNLFTPSRVRFGDLTVTQQTGYPEDGRVTVTVHAAEPTAMALRLRIPPWATGATVDGRPVPPGGYAVVDRTWAGDASVTVDLPLPLWTEPLSGDPATVAVFRGPLLLAGQLSPVDPAAELLGSSPAVPKGADPVFPIAVGDRPVTDWLRPVDGRPGTFRTRDAGLPADVDLVPLYRLGSYRYQLYWTRRQ